MTTYFHNQTTVLVTSYTFAKNSCHANNKQFVQGVRTVSWCVFDAHRCVAALLKLREPHVVDWLIGFISTIRTIGIFVVVQCGKKQSTNLIDQLLISQ